jgi:CRP/FNR family transcriptional regulator, polysaccharide utilization system transcription regulator
MNDFELLKKCKIVEHLTPEEQQLLCSKVNKVRYSKNERIIKNGEFVQNVVFIEHGYVKVHSENKGKSVILNIYGPDTFAGLSSMVGRDKQEFDITALDDTTALLIDISVIYQFVESNGLFARSLIKEMNNILVHYIHHNMVKLNQNHIHGRLANSLLYLSQSVFKSLHFDLLLSRKELSQFSNVSRENVIKILYEFDTDGLIKLNGKQIQILKLDRLNRLADIC